MPARLSVCAEADRLLAIGAVAQAVTLIEVAGARDDADALNHLALWRVYGEPLARDFRAARELFQRAGLVGHKSAALKHAVFVALGAGDEPDWRQALQLLNDAARGDPEAARQRAIIDAMAIDDQGVPRIVPSATQTSTAPRVKVLRALFTPAECTHLTDLATPLLTPSMVADPTSGRLVPHPIRTSDGAVLGPIQQDLVVHALNKRIAFVTGTRIEQGEPLSVLRYSPDQQYRLHHDCLPGEANQRVITVIVYLNDSFGGGATVFPALGHSFRGSIGDAILFHNVLRNGQPDERARHAGAPVSSGTKWICTRWIRARDFDPWGLRLQRSIDA